VSGQGDLFGQRAKYCIDTNVIVSFLRGTDDEHYGRDVFKPQWDFLELRMVEGFVVAPRQVEKELIAWQKNISEMKDWLWRHQHLFRDIVSDGQLAIAKRIVNAYPAYGLTKNYMGDLEVISLAAASGLTVITLEASKQAPSKKRPKIPDVCSEFSVDCVTFSGFLRRENFGQSG
jgi:hypothetical protein